MPIPDQARTLHDHLQEFCFDEGAPLLPFHVRLARENGWTPGYAARAITEYRRFLLLAMIAGHPVTPSDAVDQVWHLHLLYTRSYWDRLCGQIFGRPLHHDPTGGGRSEGEKFVDWYSRTLASYQRVFDVDPPRDLWPNPSSRFRDVERFVRVNTARRLVLPRFSLWNRS
jgi:hypothetical protein